MVMRNDGHHPLDGFLRDHFDIFCRGLRLPPDDPLRALCGIVHKRCRTIYGRYLVLTLDQVEGEALYQLGMLVLTGDHARSKWPALYGLRCMHNRFIDGFRSSTRAAEVMLDLATDPSLVRHVDAETPDRVFTHAQCGRALAKALARLDPSDRTIVVLHVIEGHTFQRIACELGMRSSTVHDRCKRALSRLRELIDADWLEAVA